MIRYKEFIFEDKLKIPYFSAMGMIDGLMCSGLSFANLIQSNQGDCTFEEFPNVEIITEPNKYYSIYMDQSTTCTGLTLKALDNSHLIMFEIIRDKGDTADNYISKFEDVLAVLGSNYNIIEIIYEEPIKGKSFKTERVLIQLEGTIKKLPKYYSRFKHTRINSIHVTSWRSHLAHYIGLSKQSLTDNLKYDIASHVKKIFPWCNLYGVPYGKDYDVYESLGIMTGWISSKPDFLGRTAILNEYDVTELNRLYILSSDNLIEVEKTLTSYHIDKSYTYTRGISHNTMPQYDTAKYTDDGKVIIPSSTIQDPNLIRDIEICMGFGHVLNLTQSNTIYMLCFPEVEDYYKAIEVLNKLASISTFTVTKAKKKNQSNGCPY